LCASQAKSISKILDSVGVTCDAAEVEKVLASLAGKDLDELVAAGTVLLPLARLMCACSKYLQIPEMCESAKS
jgi:ribosomal protein L12E/L44/L45/RPP1/RPP2